jgi:uncharacterized protein
VIENTFIHIPGVGQKTERKIWQQGISCWVDFLSHSGTVVSGVMDPLIRLELEDSKRNRDNIGYFADRLPASDSWRLFEAFQERAAYLDIETSGSDYGEDMITVIGLYDGKKMQSFVCGKNLQDFEIAVSSYDLLITYNGAGFDLPVIKNCFPNISLPSGHIDLRFLLSRLGYKGGLKKIEKDFGIFRNANIDGLSGFEAVQLWNAFNWGDQDALDLLLQYNAADVINLQPLMESGYNMMKKSLMPFQFDDSTHKKRPQN